jgi:hypothetical protein
MRSPTTVRSGIAHILRFAPEGRESSSACECAVYGFVTVLCDAHTFPKVILTSALVLSRDMIKYEKMARLWQV